MEFIKKIKIIEVNRLWNRRCFSQHPVFSYSTCTVLHLMQNKSAFLTILGNDIYCAGENCCLIGIEETKSRPGHPFNPVSGSTCFDLGWMNVRDYFQLYRRFKYRKLEGDLCKKKVEIFFLDGLKSFRNVLYYVMGQCPDCSLQCPIEKGITNQ